MPRFKDEPPAVRVYTVCDESRYLIVRNVPALGCGDELLKLFSSYGDVEECKPMDAEDCEEFTDIYWMKFRLVSNARFAKRKLDEYVFLGNRLEVKYAPEFESIADTKDKLEGRTREVLARLNPCRSKGSAGAMPSQPVKSSPRNYGESQLTSHVNNPPLSMIPSEKEYLVSQSIDQTVQMVREKLNKIESSSSEHMLGHTSKKAKVDNRRRI